MKASDTLKLGRTLEPKQVLDLRPTGKIRFRMGCGQ